MRVREETKAGGFPPGPRAAEQPGRSIDPAYAEAVPGGLPEENPTPARIEALSDGVFAIIVTLLVLNVRVPRASALEGGSLAEARWGQWPLGRHWSLAPIFYALAFVLAFVDAHVSLVMYAVLLLYYSTPGPAAVRWMTARRARRMANV